MRLKILFLLVTMVLCIAASAQNHALVFQSDFGLKDGAVSAMKGVAFSVSPDLKMYDITHEIPAYNIWEAAYRLSQAAPYWPAGTVFVSVVDPGVGSERKSVVARTTTGHYIVTPDNGTLTLVSESMGIAEVREIDESKNRLKGSGQSYTFHGRDVYAYTGARLAAGVITFEGVGKKREGIVKLPYQKPVLANGAVTGSIDILDIQYGNAWTNIPQPYLDSLGIKPGDKVEVKIYHDQKLVFHERLTMAHTFAGVPEGSLLGYMNSLLNFSIAVNQGNFAERYKIGSGSGWVVSLSK